MAHTLRQKWRGVFFVLHLMLTCANIIIVEVDLVSPKTLQEPARGRETQPRTARKSSTIKRIFANERKDLLCQQ